MKESKPAGRLLQSPPTKARDSWRDPVTGLAARPAFSSALADAIGRGLEPTVLVIHVSGVDAVNQTFGHQVGDEVLGVVARRLSSAVGPGTVAARFSRRFAVVVLNADPQEVEALGARLLTALHEPIEVGPTSLRVGVTIGVSHGGDGADPTVLLRQADLALVAARDAGSDWQVYDSAAHHSFEVRREREIDLRSAVSRREFEIHYQPVVDFRDSRLIGAEALIRWRRPTGEVVMPGDFIDLAESSGAIAGIGLWVLREACRQMRAWNDHYRTRESLEIAVNLSVRQLASSALTREIAGVIADADIDPRRVTLEVTESSLMDDPERMIHRLSELRELGLTLSLDDFGTGYSSLSYLRQIPVDIVKIDRSFVGGVARSDEEWALTAAIVRLATSLGKKTLAEGVETPAQLAHLRALGCHFGQGYLFGRPMPADAFEALLASAAPAEATARRR